MPYSLGYTDRWVRAMGGLITGDTDCSVPFPYLPQSTTTRIAYDWTGDTFTKLFSALKTGADLMYPELSNQLLWELLKGVHCPPPLEANQSCVEYYPSVPFVSFYPDNPYIEGDKKDGWLDDAWWTFGEMDTILPDFIDNWLQGAIETITGYESTDILCHILSLPINSVEAWLNAGNIFPSIQVKFTGSGLVRINLLSFPIGGRAIIEVDNPPNVLDILTGGIIDPSAITVELNRDILSFPPEEYPVVSIPITVAEAGSHTIYIQFLPVIDDSLIPIGFGGGIRSIEMCGFTESGLPMLDNIVFDDCTLKTVIDGVSTPVSGWENFVSCLPAPVIDCEVIEPCLSDLKKYQLDIDVFNTTNLNTIRVQNFNSYNQVIEMYNKDAPQSFYDGTQNSSDRLCLSLRYFMESLRSEYGVWGALINSEALPNVSLSSRLTDIADLMNFAAFALINPSWVFSLFENTVVSLGANLTALSDNAAFDESVCCLAQALGESPLSLSGFVSAIPIAKSCASLNNADTILDLLSSVASNEQSFLYLIDLLAEAHKAGYSSVDPCNCVTEINCSSGSPTSFPASGNITVLPSPYVYLGAGTEIWQPSTTVIGAKMDNGDSISFNVGERACISSVQLSRLIRTPLNTTGTMSMEIYTDGTLTNTVSVSGGGTQSQTFPLYVGAAYYPCTNVTLKLLITGYAGAFLEVSNFRILIKA